MRRHYPLAGPHYRRDELGKLWIDGQFYMGHTRTPSMPPRIALTDRVTGALRVLSDDGAGNVVLATVNSKWPDVIKYAANEGPYDGDWRLYLSNGTLAFEFKRGYNSAKILTRNAYMTTVVQITANQSTGAIITAPYDL